MNNTVFQNSIKEWIYNLNDEEIKALRLYTTDRYEDINEYLRESNDKQNLDEIIKKIDNALLKYKLPHNITVFRSEGRNKSVEEIKNVYKYVNSIEYLNYISTSLKKEFAVEFIEYLKYENKYYSYILIEGKLEKGCNCGYIGDKISAMSSEYEMLIMRGKIFIINEITVIDNEIIEFEGRFIQKG